MRRALAAALTLVMGLIVAPTGSAAGYGMSSQLVAATDDGCGSACGCHDHDDDEAHPDGAHDSDWTTAGHGDHEGHGHAPCPDDCDDCGCSAALGFTTMLPPPATTISCPAVGTRIQTSQGNAAHGVRARIYKPPKRSTGS